jgi:Adenylate cyclase associated (CAP) C terminal
MYVPLSRCSYQVQVPNEEDEGDYFERPIPESMRHVISNGKLVSGVLEHAG